MRTFPGPSPGPASPSRVWGEHWLDCPLCVLGDRPSEDRLCDEGRQLHDEAVADIEQRLKDFTWEMLNSSLSRPGAQNGNWRGGRRRGGEKGQYVMVYAPDHPAAVLGAVLEHRIVMEEHLGRLLERGEIVHHRNGDPRDNRIENLELLTQSEHARRHMAERERGALGRIT